MRGLFAFAALGKVAIAAVAFGAAMHVIVCV